MLPKILVSSCLIGKKCAYDGEARTSTAVKECCETYGYISICPEMEGGLGCPRERHEIVGGSGSDVLDGRVRVISISGKDMTDNFFSGAERTLKTAKANAIKVAVLKSRSPSCGKNMIHTGNFDGEAREGCGVTTALLVRNGIKVFTENEIDEIKRELKP